MSGKAVQYEATLNRLIPNNEMRPRPEGRGYAIFIMCQPCGRLVEAFSMTKRLPPQVIHSKLKQAGWQIGRHNVCPGHGDKEGEKNVAANDKVSPLKVVSMGGASASAMAVGSSDSARRAKREAMDWLSEAFDVEAGQYKAGVSDATIAKETGLSQEAVTKMREEFFGPLKAPSELLAAGGELNRLGKMLDEHGNELAKLRNSVEAVRSRIASLIERNGWKS